MSAINPEAIPLIRALAEKAEQMHYNCEEDPWYGCPLSRDGCSNDNIPRDECNCGAAEHNAEVAALMGRLKNLIPNL